MHGKDYEYRGLIASSWDFLRGNTSSFPDRHFFRALIQSRGEPVLVVGCGTGRLLLEYLSDGFDVDGIDVSPEMLAICTRKARQMSLSANLYEQSMESLNLPRRYKTIIVPSSSFQLVPDLADVAKTLNSFFKHLLAGGTLVMSIWHIKDEGSKTWGDWWLVVEKDGFENGKTLKRWERSLFDETTQLRHTENRYELLDNDEIVYTETHRRSPELRSYSPEQLSNLLEEAGFSNIRAVSGFSSEPASKEDDVFCIIGQKPAYFMTSERLGFRHWREEDFQLAKGLWGDPAVTRLIDARGRLSDSQVRQKLQQEIATEAEFGLQYWPIFLLSTGEHIGCCGLRPYDLDQNVYEIGFHIRLPKWGQGFATEAARRVIAYAFTALGAQAVFAGHNPQNTKSRQLLLKLGFHYTHDEFYEPTGLNHPSYLLPNPSRPSPRL